MIAKLIYQKSELLKKERLRYATTKLSTKRSTATKALASRPGVLRTVLMVMTELKITADQNV